MDLGIDLGTSAVKAVLVDEDGALVAEGAGPLTVSRPRPLWSEQDPEDWWRAVEVAVAALRQAADLGAVRSIGLSGQMHGATLLDRSDRPLRAAILWNDGRSADACRELEAAVPESRAITGNKAMPGFTAPKVLWVRRHEPDVFAAVRRVLLPKDWVRLRMTGDHATDVADASGTLWLDVAARRWSDAMLGACGLTREQMPTLYEGTEATGVLRADVAARWGMSQVPVAAGGGDQAAGAVGAGVVDAGAAFVSLGTSGVYFVSLDRFRADPARAVHAFCHAVPRTWHQMSVMLSAASCLEWVAGLLGRPVAELLAEVEREGAMAGDVLFLPYLTGERTPHDDPHARGAFFGLTATSGRAAMTRAVLEGVAFGLADGQDALVGSGTAIGRVSIIGGGSRSVVWGSILAAALDRPIDFRAGSDVGAAVGAARLGRLAVTGEDPATVCSPPPLLRTVTPDPDLVARYRDVLPRFRELYRATRPLLAP